MVVGDGFTNKEASKHQIRLFEMWLSKMVSKGVETSTSSIAFEANLQRTFFAGCCKCSAL